VTRRSRVSEASREKMRDIVELYKRGFTLRECGEHSGVSMQYVWKVVRKLAPEIMRKPHRHEKERKK